MIEVLLNKPEFEYDIHSLIKAFFPEQYVGVSAEKKEYDEKIDIRMQVNYGEDTIQITWQEIVHANEDAQANEKPGQEEVKEIPGETIQVDFSDRVRTKNQLKQMLYRMLCDYTKRTLPWGNLTGIRPTKIPMKLLEEGKSREEIYRYMKDTYFASDEKIELATDIAERENAILKKIDYDNGYSLYIGIPFCPTTCLYCSFTSYPLVSWKNRVDAYLDALEKEIDYTAAKFYHKHLNSIYIGGGTPTTLEPYQLDRLIRKIKCSFDLSDCLEFTVEAGRPDSITREKLEVLRKWGITRISINPQTMQQRTLDLIGRHHSVEQTVESFKIARELGFDDINMDRSYNEEIKQLFRQLGIAYARVVEPAADFTLPTDPLEWHPTCHHDAPDLMEKAEFFAEFKKKQYLKLMYVWGHSYEFDNHDNWNVIEDFCAYMGGRNDIWYATNIEIIDYMDAARRLIFSADCRRVYNPNAISVWLEIDGDTVIEVKGGTCLEI